jgi:hypothetical protein
MLKPVGKRTDEFGSLQKFSWGLYQIPNIYNQLCLSFVRGTYLRFAMQFWISTGNNIKLGHTQAFVTLFR